MFLYPYLHPPEPKARSKSYPQRAKSIAPPPDLPTLLALSNSPKMPAVNHAFTVFSLFAFTSASVPLTWHLTEASSWNAGTCLFIFWAGLSSLVWFVNSIVWDGNIVNWTPGWCDVCEFPSFPGFSGIGQRVEIRPLRAT